MKKKISKWFNAMTLMVVITCVLLVVAIVELMAGQWLRMVNSLLYVYIAFGSFLILRSNKRLQSMLLFEHKLLNELERKYKQLLLLSKDGVVAEYHLVDGRQRIVVELDADNADNKGAGVAPGDKVQIIIIKKD